MTSPTFAAEIADDTLLWAQLDAVIVAASAGLTLHTNASAAATRTPADARIFNTISQSFVWVEPKGPMLKLRPAIDRARVLPALTDTCKSLFSKHLHGDNPYGLSV